LQLEVFAPPLQCELFKRPYYQLKISINWTASLGNFFLRYRTILATWPLAVTCLVVLLQFREYNNSGMFITFSHAILMLFRSYLLYILVGLSVFQLLFASFSGLLTGMVSLIRFPSVQNNADALAAYSSEWTQNTIFLGLSDSSLWFVGPLFFVICLGLVILVHAVVQFILANASILIRFFSKESFGKGFQQDKTISVYALTHISKRATPAIISIIVLYHIPYQVMFIFVVVFMAIITQRSYLRPETPSLKEQSSVNFYNYTMSIFMLFAWPCVVNAPMLAVWLKNLSLKWSFVFSTYHNVFSIIPIILLVINIQNGNMIPQVDSSIEKNVTLFILGYTAFYAVFFGFIQTYMVHHLINVFCGWLLLLYVKDFKTPILSENMRKF
jgi:GPI inositol-deacylase